MVSLLAAMLGVLVASLVEYLVHRLMHSGLVQGRRHAEHHRDGWGQGFWPELRDYVLPASPVIAAGWLPGPAFGAGWTAGCLGYAVFAAYGHQLQHDNPLACRWMRMPVHYVHHRDQMWHHNFGLAVDWWDHVFRTYKPVPFGAEFGAEQRGRGPFDIHWLPTDGEGQPLARRAGPVAG